MIAVLIVIVHLGTHQDSSFGEATIAWPEEGTTIIHFLESLSAFVFAYQGQSIYMELMAEMKNPNEFPKSCNVAYTIMAFMYCMTVTIAYGMEGEEVPGFLPNILDDGAAKTCVGILVCLHIMVSYVIAGQPLHMYMHAVFFPKTMNQITTRGKIDWFIITGGYIVFGFIIGNLIPFFADVQALIGALFGAPIIFGWPALFFFMLHRKKSDSWKQTIGSMGMFHFAICSLFLFVLMPLFCILGTVGAIKLIIEDIKVAGKPFAC